MEASQLFAFGFAARFDLAAYQAFTRQDEEMIVEALASVFAKPLSSFEKLVFVSKRFLHRKSKPFRKGAVGV